jgi:anti-sigma B factor antagonist
MFELTTGSNESGKKIIILSGEIDIYSAPDFKDSLFNAIGEGKEDVVLDCTNLSYIDSMGLGILVAALKRLKQNDFNLYIRNSKPNIRKLFKITGLEKVFIMEEAK